VTFQTPITVEAVLRKIYAKDYLMPAIQREFVWDRDDIIKLFDSLLRGYPVGSFLFWDVTPERAEDYIFYGFLADYHERDFPYAVKSKVPAGVGTTAILDGQQRLTSLNIGLYGSHATRRLYGRVNSPDAYPVKRLYLNLLDAPADGELGLLYDLRFLTADEARPDAGEIDKWFLVGEILKLNGKATEYLKLVGDRGFNDMALATEATDRLDTLYTAIRKEPSINYYLVEDQDPNKVLEIFIRVNSGGQQLSKSDLLLSMATNQWSTEPGAREEVRSLVTELNSRGFNFSKDFVLKTALMIIGVDVRFQVSNITRPNITKMENNWAGIRTALLLTADLLKQSGFSSRTLTATNAAIIVAYYMSTLDKTKVGSYLDSSHTAADRDEVVGWITRSLLKQGFWGSGVDTLLTRLRSALDNESSNSGFPAGELEAAAAKQGKALTFDEAEVDALLASEYGGAKTFSLLATLYPGLDLSKDFHEDHVFPKSLFNSKSLKNSGIPEEQIPEFLEAYNSLPNLQLLMGTRNNEKLAMLPSDWIREHFHSDDKRATYLAENDLEGLPLELPNFLVFFEKRRERMRDKLMAKLKGNELPADSADGDS
jgi:hypothetical protein